MEKALNKIADIISDSAYGLCDDGAGGFSQRVFVCTKREWGN